MVEDDGARRKCLREYGPIFLDYSNHEIQKLVSDTGYKSKCDIFYQYYDRPFSNYENLISEMLNE